MFNILSHQRIVNQNYLRFHLVPVRMATIKKKRVTAHGTACVELRGKLHTLLIGVQTSVAIPQKDESQSTSRSS